MKNKLKLVFSFLVIGVLFFSCDKSNPDGGGDDNKDPVISGKSCRLKSINDKGELTTFYYNSEGQVLQILTPSDDGLTLLFAWGDNGKVIGVDINNDNSDIGDLDYILEYDNSGKIVKANAKGLDGETGDTLYIDIAYHYDGNRVASVDFLTEIQQIRTKTIKDYTYKDGNVSLMKVTLEVNGAVFTSATSSYQYDNKKNPFYDLGIGNSFGVISGDLALLGSKNNYIKLIRKDALGNVIDDESRSNTFEYNNDGYPVKITDKNGTSILEYFECK